MATTIQAAGFMAHKGDTVYGAGVTEEACRADADRTARIAGIDADYDVVPASAALVAAMSSMTPPAGWSAVGEVRCTDDEYRAAQ